MAVMVYITAANEQEAQSIASSLIHNRLAACINILGPINSLFHWGGSVQSESEVAFTAKTSLERLEALTHHVQSIHSYEEPCIVALPIIGGSTSFLNWIKSETCKEP